jgi:ribosomal protein L16 Arg81 hydroxylase
MPAPLGNKNAKANSIFTEELAENICEELATTSKSLRTICKQEGMPTVRTVLSWLSQGEKSDADEKYRLFLHQYVRAREAQADFLAEEIIEIADDGSNDLMTITKGDRSYEAENKEVTNRSRLRVDARKWIASKLKPRKYGDKIDMNHQGQISLNQITGMEVK